MKKSLKKRKHQPKLRSIRDHIGTLLIYNPSSAYHYGDHGWWILERLRRMEAMKLRLGLPM